MKSFVLLSLLIILVLADFASSQKCRELRFLLRDSSCGKTEYVKGFYRERGEKYEAALLIRHTKCCTALPPDESSEQNCTFIRLRDELNKYVNHLIKYF